MSTYVGGQFVVRGHVSYGRDDHILKTSYAAYEDIT